LFNKGRTAFAGNLGENLFAAWLVRLYPVHRLQPAANPARLVVKENPDRSQAFLFG
jgi:hypothetical protein